VNYLLSSQNLIKHFLFSILRESGPVHEIEMIQLSTWEWFLLLSFAIILTWLLILFQVRSTRENEYIEKNHANHEESANNDS
jgi:hypothetical protein